MSWCLDELYIICVLTVWWLLLMRRYRLIIIYETPEICIWSMLGWGLLTAELTHILQGYYIGTRAIIWLVKCQWSNPEEYRSMHNVNLTSPVDIALTKQSTRKPFVTLYGIYMYIWAQQIFCYIYSAISFDWDLGYIPINFTPGFKALSRYHYECVYQMESLACKLSPW